MPTASQQRLAMLAERILMPPAPVSCSAWADEHRVVVNKSSPLKGQRWRTDRVPHTRVPMDAFSDPVVRHISIMKPTQCAGTEIVINGVLYLIARAPGSMYWVWSNDKNAADFGRDRFLAELKACAPAAAKLTNRKHDEKGTELKLSDMTIRFRGAPPHGQGIRGIESESARYIANDELDRCDPDIVDIMDKRTSAYAGSCKKIDLGSPGLEDAGIDEQVKKSAGGGLYYWLPCPRCGRFFVPNFEMVKWDGGGKADPDYVRKSAWLRCPHCDGKVLGYEHRAMMSLGVWAPDWNENRPITENPLPARARIDACLHAAHVGFRIGEFSDPFALNPYGDVAAEFVNNKTHATQTWTTHRRGRPWSTKGQRVEEHDLTRLCVLKEKGGYGLGYVPSGVLCLVTSIDVQETCAYVLVRGWGLKGRESWLVWTQRIMLPGGDLTPLDQCVGWGFPLVPGWCDENGEVLAGGGKMNIAFTAIDSGDRTIEVYDWVRRMTDAGRNVTAVKGQPGTGSGQTKPQWFGQIDRYPNGETIPGGLALLNVNTNHWKNWLLTRLKRESAAGAVVGAGFDADTGGRGDEAAWLGGCVFRFPEAVHEPGVPPESTSAARMATYFRHMQSEQRVAKIIKSSGRKVMMWDWAPGGGRENHYLDDEVYNAAAVAMDTVGGSLLVRCVGVEPAGERRAAGVVVKEAAREARQGPVVHAREEWTRTGGLAERLRGRDG